jgi:hypothetical protein
MSWSVRRSKWSAAATVAGPTAGGGVARHLGDRAGAIAQQAGALEDRGEVGVHVPGIAAATGNLLPRGADLPERLTIVRDVGHDDEHAEAGLKGEILRRGDVPGLRSYLHI